MHIQNNLMLWYIIVTCLFIIRILLLCYRSNLYHALKTVILKTPFITLPTLGNLCIRANSWTKKWALFKKIFRFARYKSAQFDTLVLHSYRRYYMRFFLCSQNGNVKPWPHETEPGWYYWNRGQNRRFFDQSEQRGRNWLAVTM